MHEVTFTHIFFRRTRLWTPLKKLHLPITLIQRNLVHSVDTPDFRTRIRDVLNSRTLTRVAFRYKTLHGYNVRAVHFQVRLTR